MKRTLTAVWACGLTVAMAIPAMAKTYSCEINMTQSAMGRSQKGHVSLWADGPTTSRTEQSSPAFTMVTIQRGTDIWMFPKERPKSGPWMGQHVKLPPAAIKAAQKRGRPFGHDISDLALAGAKKTGQETIAPDRCDVYKTPAGKQPEVTFWIAQGPEHLTRRKRMVVTVPDRTGKKQQMTMLMDYVNWKVGGPLSPSLFQVPRGPKFATAQMPVGPRPAGPAVKH